MADNRIWIRRRGVRANEYGLTIGGNQARMEADAVALRDALRAAFASPRYRISDIARWVGLTGTIGLAFLFRDTTKGCEWLFGFGGRSDSGTQAWLYQIFGNNSAATMGAYFKLPANTWSNPSTSNGGFGCMFFNYDYVSSSFAFGFTDTTALTYGLGDFQTPASSPYSALSSFMPSTTGRYHGVDFANWTYQDGWNRSSVLYDEPRGVMSIDATQGSSFGGGFSLISGKEMFPTNAAGGVANALDTRRDGVVFIPRIAGSNGAFNVLDSVSNIVVMFVRDNGTTVETQGRLVNLLNDFTRANYLAGGNVQKRKLQVNAGGYIKGFLDVEIINESFPHNDGGFYMMPLALPDVDNPMLHWHPQVTTLWKAGVAPLPIIPETGLPIT